MLQTKARSFQYKYIQINNLILENSSYILVYNLKHINYTLHFDFLRRILLRVWLIFKVFVQVYCLICIMCFVYVVYVNMRGISVQVLSIYDRAGELVDFQFWTKNKKKSWGIIGVV